jgi:hypothetical protein
MGQPVGRSEPARPGNRGPGARSGEVRQGSHRPPSDFARNQPVGRSEPARARDRGPDAHAGEVRQGLHRPLSDFARNEPRASPHGRWPGSPTYAYPTPTAAPPRDPWVRGFARKNGCGAVQEPRKKAIRMRLLPPREPRGVSPPAAGIQDHGVIRHCRVGSRRPGQELMPPAPVGSTGPHTYDQLSRASRSRGPCRRAG